MIDTGANKRHSYTMTATTAPHITLVTLLDQFIRELDKSPLTIQAYRVDIRQFITWLTENDCTATTPTQVYRTHIAEFLKFLDAEGHTGTTRARKLISLQVFFTYLVREGVIPHSPAATIDSPRKERKPKHFLRPDEYNRVLAAAGAHLRDFAVLQLFLQTGIRVSELVAIQLKDLDVVNKTLTIHGKGSKEREIPLEKKAMQALKSWLAVRENSADQHVFLSYQGGGLSIRGVRKLVDKYIKQAGITKQISCHGLRHTFGFNKGAMNMNAFAIQRLMGHERMETTRIYVNLDTDALRPVMEATSL